MKVLACFLVLFLAGCIPFDIGTEQRGYINTRPEPRKQVNEYHIYIHVSTNTVH